MVQGSCLCGGVRFEIDEREILMANHCHCSNCRKVSGAAYGTFIQIAREHFRWLAGNDLVSTYESSPGIHRAFCKQCGSRTPQTGDASPHFTVPAGTLDSDPGVRPVVSVFSSSKAPWCAMDEAIPSLPDGGSMEFWSSFAPARAFMEVLTRPSTVDVPSADTAPASPVATVMKLLAALGARDLEAARAYWSHDAVWHMAGRHESSGDYSPGAYLDTLNQWFLKHPSYAGVVATILTAGDEVVCVSVRSSGGAAPDAATGLLIYRVVDGIIVEGWAIPAFANGVYAF